MPQLGETVSEGTVIRWLRSLGERITDQEPLLEIATDKVDTEIPAPVSGILTEIVVPEDSTVSVGTVLAVIAAEEPVAGAPAPPATSAPGPLVRDTPQVAPVARSTPPGARDRVFTGHRHLHSPRVRKRAHDAGVALDQLRGSGPGGRVTMDDLATEIDASANRMAMARASALQTPGAVLASVCVVEADVTDLVRYCESQPINGDAQLTLTACAARAVIAALGVHPKLNDAVGVESGGGIDLGIGRYDAVGQISAVVRNARDLNLEGMGRRLQALTREAADDASDETLSTSRITLVDAGSHGVLFETPALAPGQVCILSIGSVSERVAVARDTVGSPTFAVRSTVHVALCYDAGAVNGAEAARFLSTLVLFLSAPPTA